MKMNKKFLAGAMALAIMVPAAAFAAENTTSTTAVTSHVKMDAATHQKVHDIRDQLAAGTITQEEAQAQVAELGLDASVLEKRGGKHGGKGFGKLLSGLDTEAQTKAKDILQQVKAGTLTADEAKTQLADLGVDSAALENMQLMSDATHQKVHDIRDQLAAGTITQEQAQAQVAELGLDASVLEKRGGKHGGKGFGKFLSGLDTEAQTKAKDILQQVKAGTLTADEAKTQLADLGVDSTTLENMQLMSDATHQKVHDIRDQLAAGTITQEQAQAQVAELGLDASVLEKRGGKHGGKF